MGNMSVIENGTAYSVFKRRVLDKNTLTSKGSLYIGSTDVEEDGVYETEELAPPSERKFLVNDASGNIRWDDLYKTMSATEYNALTTKEQGVMYFVYPD